MAHDMQSVSLVKDLGAAPALPPFIKFRSNPQLHKRKMEELLGCVRQFFTAAGLHVTATMADVDDYFEAMSHNRAFAIPGTTHGNGTLWLFLLARALQPKVIVESGVYHGSSLFTFRSAVPKSRMFAFDVNFGTLLSRLDGVDYREHDWAIDNIRAESPSDLCFFDDHINNCMRLRQAYDRGFRHIVVDDAPDVGEIHQFRYPAVPSIAMIENGGWVEGDTVEWNWNGRRLSYTFRAADTFGAKDLIQSVWRFPSLRRWTGMEDSLHYYVRLKPS